MDEIAKDVKFKSIELGSGRIQDTWAPLMEVANAIDDPRYSEAVERAIESEKTIFSSGQDYEPESLVIHALDALTWDKEKEERKNIDIELPELAKKVIELGDVQLTQKQIEEILVVKGFKVSYTRGYKYVRADTVLLESLL